MDCKISGLNKSGGVLCVSGLRGGEVYDKDSKLFFITILLSPMPYAPFFMMILLSAFSRDSEDAIFGKFRIERLTSQHGSI